MGWAGSTFKDPLVLAPCNGQVHIPLGQAAQIMSSFKALQGNEVMPR